MAGKVRTWFLIFPFGLFSVFSVSLCCHSAEPGPTFTLDTASGKPLQGPLRELGPGWAVRLGDGRADGADVVALRRHGTSLPPPPLGEHVVFANGDRLPGRVGTLAGERLGFQLGTEALQLPLSALSVIWLAPPDGAEPDRLLRRLATESRTHDVVLLRNGDAVEGTVTGLDERAIRLDVNRKELSVERGKVAAIALNSELAAPPRPTAAYGRLVLRDGTRLSLASAACADGQSLTGETLFRAAVRFPVEDVVALAVRGGPAVYLSELKAKKYEHTAYLGVAWPYVLDGSADRRDLRLGGDTFDRGVGLHTASRLTYDLGGRGDDEELTAAGARPVRVDVTGAKELTLVVEFGARGGVRGHVDWADARLVK
jgi:hypothetical protein